MHIKDHSSLAKVLGVSYSKSWYDRAALHHRERIRVTTGGERKGEKKRQKED